MTRCPQLNYGANHARLVALEGPLRSGNVSSRLNVNIKPGAAAEARRDLSRAAGRRRPQIRACTDRPIMTGPHIHRQQVHYRSHGRRSRGSQPVDLRQGDRRQKVRHRAARERARRGRLAKNVQGEQQQKLDVISNEVLLRTLGQREGVAIVASGGTRPVIIRDDVPPASAATACCSIRSTARRTSTSAAASAIFSILRHDRRAKDAADSLLQPGDAAGRRGYVLYGLVGGVRADGRQRRRRIFVLDPAIGAFLRVQRRT